MEKSMLGEDIKSRSFARFYFLYGSEKFILDFYVGQMIDAILPEEAKTFDLHWHDGKELSAGDFVSEMEAFPMLAEKKVVAIKDLPLQSETAKALLADPGILNDDTVLLVYASREDYDRTKKEFKEFWTQWTEPIRSAGFVNTLSKGRKKFPPPIFPIFSTAWITICTR